MGEHILVVDDCEDVRFLLALKLKKLGYEVVEATDGEDAIEVLNEDDDIKIMLVDIMMPGVSGLDLLKDIREKFEKENITVILITASKEDNIMDKAKSLGADGLISKPIKDKNLKEQLSLILNN
jgi:CheY-like chemotaxis protein